MMTIKLFEVTIGEVAKGYVNNEEQGVRGYNGQLDIRPPYQREFIYNEKEQQAVIHTVLQGYPLNVMYWVRKLEWFQTINMKQKPLTDQEIRNAIYAGPFVSDAKRYFSKTNCAAYRLGKDLVTGTLNRQEFLERALEWIAEHENRQGHQQSVVGYMADHQHDPNANNLWSYFQNVLNWAITNFDMKRFKKIMKGLNWALLYDNFGPPNTLDTEVLAKRISELMRDTNEIQKQTGIIPYVLTGDEHYLDLRAFPEDIKLAVWENQGHKCAKCGKEFDYEFMEGDHITPWRDGGRTVVENCQMLCRECNRRKGAK